MKIKNVETVKKLIKYNVKSGFKEVNDNGSVIYTVGDLTSIFNVVDGKSKFNGFVFETLGRNFIITSGFDVVTTAFGEDGVEETYDITDEKFLELLEKFLEWRLEVISSLEI